MLPPPSVVPAIYNKNGPPKYEFIVLHYGSTSYFVITEIPYLQLLLSTRDSESLLAYSRIDKTSRRRDRKLLPLDSPGQ